MEQENDKGTASGRSDWFMQPGQEAIDRSAERTQKVREAAISRFGRVGLQARVPQPRAEEPLALEPLDVEHLESLVAPAGPAGEVVEPAVEPAVLVEGSEAAPALPSESPEETAVDGMEAGSAAGRTWTSRLATWAVGVAGLAVTTLFVLDAVRHGPRTRPS